MGVFDRDFDPFARHDPLSKIGKIPNAFGGGQVRQPRAEFRRPLPPEESAAFGKHALDAGASGLNYVLGAIDKPGQAVRGLLAGHGASALKHLVPFSDSIGLTTDADHVSGRDLTDQLGITSKRDNGWGAWGAGLAADIATDPLTYMTFGAKHALTTAGKAAQKTGALRGLSREALLQGDYSGLVRVGIPMGPGAVLGTGRTAQAIARGLDKTGDFLRFGNPVGRAAGALFDDKLHGAVDAITQRGAEKYLDPALKELKAAARNDNFGVLEQLDPLVKAGAHPESTITEAARAVAEGVPHPFEPALATQVEPLARHIGGVNSRYFDEARKAGAPISGLGDTYAKYVHRQALDVNHRSLQLGGRQRGNMFPVVSGSNIGREEVLRNVPGGTNRINDWFRRFAGNADQPTVAAEVLKDLVSDFGAGGGRLRPETMKVFAEKADALAARLAHASERYTKEGLPFFTPDLAADMTQRGAQHARTVASAKAAIGILGDVAKPLVPGSDMVALPEAIRRLGLQTTRADLKGGTPMQGALVQMYRALAPHGVGPVDPFLMGKRAALRKQLANFGISGEHFGQIAKAYQKWATPEQLKSPLGFLDSITNTFKALAYPIWIPAHVRNAMTAATNNAANGVGLRDYLAQLKVMTGRGAHDLSSINPALRGLSTAEQINWLRKNQFSSANIFGGHGIADDVADSALGALRSGQGRFTPRLPGSDRVGPTGNLVGDAANLVLREGLLSSLAGTGKAIGGSLSGLFNKSRRWGQSIGENLGIKGVGGVTRDVLPAVRAGRTAGTNIEDFFRGAQWNSQVRRGAAPSVAADAVNRLHFDYDALTGFEKNVMRRLVPFYTFARRNLPLQAENLVTRPGVINAQYKPFNQPEPGGKGFVPNYLSSGVAIPTGPEEDGKRQYVSKLGLPAEEAFERLHFRNGLPDVRATALDYMGQLNPVIKAPLEQLFDTQFHTQRRLSDLKAPAAASAVGRLFGEDNPQLLSQVMSNSPFTRFFTSADKLADPRKSLAQKLLNLGTGVRVTDVDTDKQRAVELRNTLEQMMQGHPHLSQYSNFYVRPEDAQSLTPEEIRMMRLYSELQDRAKQFAKDQRAKIGVRP
jgi:hypothetical protein